MKKALMAVLVWTFSLLAAQAQDLGRLAQESRAQRLKVMKERSVRVWNNDNMPKKPANEGPTAAGGMSSSAPPPNYPGAFEAEPPPTPDPEPPGEGPDLDSLRGELKQKRAGMKGMEDRLRLAEDELSLLQVQQASELSPETQAALAPQIQGKRTTVAALRGDIEKAKKEIEKLEKEFKTLGGTLEEKK